MRKKTQEEFINEVKKVHGDKYGLDKCVYSGYLKHVTVICPIHGEFMIRADHFLSGCGCHKCAKEQANKAQMLTIDEYIDRCNVIHKHKYIYDKSHYRGLDKLITIICPIHGEFKQKAGNHLNSQGCPKCGLEERTRKNTLSFDEFYERANKIHNFKYHYDKDSYKGGKYKVKIFCPIHGEFEQVASVHLLGQGCPKCGREKSINCIAILKTFEEFVKEANIVHNFAYDYRKTVYVNNYTKSIFTCPIHGDFKQTPHNHLLGTGCPRCKRSILEEKSALYMDKLGIKYIHHADRENFEWLGLQHLDFYLPDYNVAIECQGIQHFEPIDFAGKGKKWAKEKFERTLFLDEMKRKKCEENGVILKYISYNDDISEKIEQFIKNQ